MGNDLDVADGLLRARRTYHEFVATIRCETKSANQCVPHAQRQRSAPVVRQQRSRKEQQIFTPASRPDGNDIERYGFAIYVIQLALRLVEIRSRSRRQLHPVTV